MLPKVQKIPEFDFDVPLMRTLDDGTKLYLVVGRSQRLVEDISVSGNACLMRAQTQDGAQILSSISDWAGVPPIPQVSGRATVYIFADDEDGHHPIPNPDSTTAQTLIRDGRVVVVMDQTFPSGVTMIGYFRPVRSSADIRPHQ